MTLADGQDGIKRFLMPRRETLRSLEFGNGVLVDGEIYSVFEDLINLLKLHKVVVDYVEDNLDRFDGISGGRLIALVDYDRKVPLKDHNEDLSVSASFLLLPLSFSKTSLNTSAQVGRKIVSFRYQPLCSTFPLPSRIYLIWLRS